MYYENLVNSLYKRCQKNLANGSEVSNYIMSKGF